MRGKIFDPKITGDAFCEKFTIKGQEITDSEVVATTNDMSKKKVKRRFRQAPLKDGEKVIHPSFGKGIIVEVKGDIVTVAFKKEGIKKLAASIAPLKII